MVYMPDVVILPPDTINGSTFCALQFTLTHPFTPPHVHVQGPEPRTEPESIQREHAQAPVIVELFERVCPLAVPQTPLTGAAITVNTFPALSPQFPHTEVIVVVPTVDVEIVDVEIVATVVLELR